MVGLPGGRASAQDVRVFIDTPADGSFIDLRPGETVPVQRPVSGHVEGIDAAVLARDPLLVAVTIRTSRDYPQGIARVDPETGGWSLQGAHFGGAVHVIRAVLMDRERTPPAATSVTVTLIQ